MEFWEGSELGGAGSCGGGQGGNLSGRGRVERAGKWDEGLKEKRVVTIIWQLF